MNRFLNFFTPRRTVRLGAGLLAAFAIVVVLAGRAEAQSNPAAEVAEAGLNLAVTGIFAFLNTILVVIIQTVGEITSLIVSLLVAISQYNKFSTVKVVDVGWTIVKDVSNMLFIIALLVIAAGTVLRLENYRYNRLLSNLIIMAFLANFSKFIAAFFIQGAQVLMLTFVNAYREALYGNFISLFGIEDVLRFNPIADGSGMDSASVFANLLGSLLIVTIAAIVTAAILVVIVVRIVALWILVILSPFAFASQILPNTKSMATRWWKEFGTYVTQGPILAFFLWLALAIVNVGGGTPNDIDPSLGDLATNLKNQQANVNYFDTAVFDFDNIITFVISTAFLMFGLNYATSSSGAAGKWAGKVAGAGFAGAATLSGLNAIRDRTIAPVQGWIKNRGAARQSAIQERTQTLEAAGDRVRASIGDQSIAVPFTRGRLRVGPGQAGAEKAQAAANVYERQRTQRVAQSRGFEQMTTQQQQSILQNSTDPRDRMAMLQVLKQQGKLNLRDPYQRAAFEKTLTDSRVSSEEKRKLRNQTIQENLGALKDDQAVRDWRKLETDPELRTIMTKELERRKALNHEDPNDVAMINETRLALDGLPAQLKEFDDALERSNPKMALETIFNGLRNGTQDGARLISHMQQGLIDGSALDARTMATFHKSLVDEATAAGQTAPQANQFAESYLLRNITKNARTKGDFDRIMNSFSGDPKRILRANAVLEDDTSSEKRGWVADTGAIEEAFTRINPIGNRELLEGIRDEYYQLNGRKIAENFEAGNMTDNTIKNDVTRSKIIGLDEVDSDSILKATKGEYARKIFSEAQSLFVEGLDKSQAGWDNSTDQGKKNNKQRSALGLAARGGKVTNAAGSKVEVLEQAWGMSAAERATYGSAAVAESKKMMERFVKTEGRNLSKMTFGDLTTGTKEIVVNNMNVRSLAAIHDKNPATTIEIVKEIRNKEKTSPAGSPDKKKFEELVKKIDRDDTLAGLGN